LPHSGKLNVKASEELIELKRVTKQSCADQSTFLAKVPGRARSRAFRLLVAAAFPLLLLLAGCGGGTIASNNASNGTFSITPGSVSIDTNCAGCNAKSSSGGAVEQFSATLVSGGAATVTWSISAGGDANSGRGSIDSSTGQYIPPSYLTADRVQVTVTAALTSNPSLKASTVVTITPGFLQPLTPENAALGANGALTVTGYIAEAGGSTGITWNLANKSNGTSGGQGSLGTPTCIRVGSTFTHCSITYTAPSSVASTSSTYVVATIGTSSSKSSATMLLNTAGVTSNPATHELQQKTAPVLLGASGGNNNDYDQSNGQITNCCGGTLGSLIKNSSGTQYILSNNHVLARSDQPKVGETIVQPRLIDDNCNPFGNTGANISAVGTLTGFLSLKSTTTNADAAIAAVNSGAVDPSGAILELGALQGGTLAAAPPGVTSTGGLGEKAILNMTVAKSGRTTGLTCASVSALSVDVSVDYYSDCAESKHYLTKTYTNQIAVTGNQFNDAGDSGALVVDAANAEPVGLFFAGGVDTTGVSVGIANPAPDVLSELGAMNSTTYTFVGTTDHPVSCLNYGNGTATAAQSAVLTPLQATHAEQAMNQARMLVSSSTGILGVATGKSSDHQGEPAVILYVDQSRVVSAPATVDGVRTQVIPTTSSAVAFGVAPETPQDAAVPALLASPILKDAIAAKNVIAPDLMRQNSAFFAVGVGQSLDDPSQAALVIYVDRKNVPAQLPATISGIRTRYVIMDRLHVTRSYATPLQSHSRCIPHSAPYPAGFDLLGAKRRSVLQLR
jgi:hypothetical protein